MDGLIKNWTVNDLTIVSHKTDEPKILRRAPLQICAILDHVCLEPPMSSSITVSNKNAMGIIDRKTCGHLYADNHIKLDLVGVGPHIYLCKHCKAKIYRINYRLLTAIQHLCYWLKLLAVILIEANVRYPSCL